MSDDEIQFVKQNKVVGRIRLTEEVILEYLWESGWYWTWLKVKFASKIRDMRRRYDSGPGEIPTRTKM